jgi:hypothetical protein
MRHAPGARVMRAHFLSLLLLVACTSGTTSAPSPDPTPGDPPAEPPAGPTACDSGQYQNGDTGKCQAFPGLAVARSAVQVTPIRDHHSTVIIETNGGPYLYVLGGTDAWQTIGPDVQRAKVHDDGTLDPFEKVGDLPEPRAGQCMTKVAADRYLIAGGVTVNAGKMGVSNTTVLVRFDADGKITDMTPGPILPYAVMHLTCDTSPNGYVYALGGRGTNSRSTTMATRAKIQPDGTIGEWENQTKLNPDRSHHAAFIREKRIYMVGGLTGDPVGNQAVSHDDCVYADIDDQGKLGDWKSAGKMPVAASVSSAQLYEDAVYTFGGLENDNSTFSDAIRRATFNADGTLTAFTTLKSKLPEPRGHVHDTPIWKNFIFSAGGQDDLGESLGTVDVGTFN